MSEPKRWLASLGEAPEGVGKLLSAYSPAAAIPDEIHGRLLAKATQLSALKPLGVTALLASKPAASAIAAAIAGATALSMSRPAVPADTPRAPLGRSLGSVREIASRRAEPMPVTPEPDPVVAVEQLAPEQPPRAESKVKTAPSSSPKREGSLAEEVALVDQAQKLLEQDPALALRLCREHESRFHDGQLRSTREALTMRALRKLGRVDEARQHAESLLARDPATLHAEEAAELIGEERRDPE